MGFCNITIPKELVWGELSIYKDDTLLINGTDYLKTENTSHWSFYVTFDHSTHSFKIIATNIIPEFPSWIILPLFLVVTLFGIIIRKKLRDLRTSPIS